jgi:hypothetical protein
MRTAPRRPEHRTAHVEDDWCPQKNPNLNQALAIVVVVVVVVVVVIIVVVGSR